MKRLLVVIGVSIALISTTAMLRQHSVPTRNVPPFLELKERGFNPISSCKLHPTAPLETTNVNLIVHDTVLQAGNAAGCVAPQNEPSLTANPVDPTNLVAGANDYRTCCDSVGRHDGTGWAYVSHDRGTSWDNVLVKGLTVETGGTGMFQAMDSAGDPSLAFDKTGKVYYANMVFSRSGFASGLAVASSRDGGTHWSKPRMVYVTDDPMTFNDKEWVAVAPDGTIVVTWTKFNAVDMFSYTAHIFISSSTDGGRHWTHARQVTDEKHPGNQGSIPLFAPNGDLTVIFETASTDHGKDAIGVATSKNYYRFSKTHEVARVYDDLGCYPQNADSRDTLTGMGFRAGALPAAAINADGTVAIAWADGQNGCTGNKDYWPKHTDAQVKIVYVNGASHSTAQIVTSGGDKVFPAVTWIGKTPVVSFYTRSFTDCVTCLDTAYASAKDGWIEHRLSDGSGDTYEQFGGAFIGDYTALVTTGDSAYAIWTDSRGANQNIFGQLFTP